MYEKNRALYDMDYLRRLKLNNDKLAVMKPRVAKYQQMIQWKNNAECNTLDEMVQAAKLGLDCGFEKTKELMPDSGFHKWVSYCFVHTKLYNRDRTADMPELLCIIRTVFFQRVNFLHRELSCLCLYVFFILLIETDKLPL